MQNGEGLGDGAPAVDTTKGGELAGQAGQAAPEGKEGAGMSKHSVRLGVWRALESSGQAVFPRPVYNRIPNHRGAADAAARLADLDVFKHAALVKVDPDKPLEPLRILCLEAGKQLVVTAPRRRPAPRRKRDADADAAAPPDDTPADKQGEAGEVKEAKKEAGEGDGEGEGEGEEPWLVRVEAPPGGERAAVSRAGIHNHGKPIPWEESLSFDLVVVGSVAVDRAGHRIGKGKGYLDLELGMLSQLKMLKPGTVVATLVHDLQVVEELPGELFGPHDFPLDMVVTPTQVIMCGGAGRGGGGSEGGACRPGVLWSLVSARRLATLPALQRLRQLDMQSGRECVLREEDTDVEEGARQRRRSLRMRQRSTRTRSHQQRNHRAGRGGGEGAGAGAASEGEGEGEGEESVRRVRPRRARTDGRRERAKGDRGDKEGSAPAAPGTAGAPGATRARKPRRPRPLIDFSLKISNISAGTRVRDVKQALSECGVKPHIMVWKGFRGFCYLHFIKQTTKSEGEASGGEAEAGVEGAGSGGGAEAVVCALAALSVRESGGGGATPYTPTVEVAPPRHLPASTAAPTPA